MYHNPTRIKLSFSLSQAKTEKEKEFEEVFRPITKEELDNGYLLQSEQPLKYDDDGTLNEEYVEYMRIHKPDVYKYLKDSCCRKCNMK